MQSERVRASRSAHIKQVQLLGALLRLVRAGRVRGDEADMCRDTADNRDFTRWDVQ
jgi:hypothetical protein